ncbi:MAG: hypothetical protein KH586_01275 [Tannerella sp.]|nr:hypothetical protein [Tannerella sp.]
MKHYYSPLFIVIGLFFLSLNGCREKGTPFSFTTPEGEEVSLIIPPGFEDQRTANPWKKIFSERDLIGEEHYIASYIYQGKDTNEIIELYFSLKKDPGTAKKWRRKPENRELYDYTEYPDSNFICVARIEYFNDPYSLYLSGGNEFPPDCHSADLHLQKQTFDIFMCFPHDSLMTELAKTVMDDIVKSIKIK